MTTVRTSALTVERRAFARALVPVLAAGGALALAGQIRVPLPWTPVPATLQTFVLLLAAALLGPARGPAAAALLWIGGASGLPIFQGGAAGAAYALGATGGYLIAMVPAAALVGWASRRSARALLLAMVGASLGILGVGALWLSVASGLQVGEAAKAGVLPFLPGDALKVAAAWLGVRAFARPARRAVD